MIILLFAVSVVFVPKCIGENILCVFPTPSYGNNLVYAALLEELAERGNSIVVLTTEPKCYREEFTEINKIDVRELSYKIWQKRYATSDVEKTMEKTYNEYFETMLEITDAQLNTKEVKEIIFSKGPDFFDLLIVESSVPTMFAFREKFKIPVVAIAPGHTTLQNYDSMGVPTHPLLYQDVLSPSTEKLTFVERLKRFYRYFEFRYKYYNIYLPKFENLAKKHFGNSTTAVGLLEKQTEVMLINIHHQILGERPMVPGVVLTGNYHIKRHKELPDYLNKFIDSSEQGVIYFSLGTDILSKNMPIEKVRMFVQAFAELPFYVIWKWENGTLEGHPKNVMIHNWYPQKDILANPKVLAFITSGGRQSIDEAIQYQKPIIGIPIFGDHHFNVQRAVQLGIGVKLDYQTLTKEELKTAIVQVINNVSYKKGMSELAALMEDEIVFPLEKAVYWVEYTLRHQRGPHLKSSIQSLPMYQYFFLDVALILFTTVLAFLFCLILGCLKVKRIFGRKTSLLVYHANKKNK